MKRQAPLCRTRWWSERGMQRRRGRVRGATGNGSSCCRALGFMPSCPYRPCTAAGLADQIDCSVLDIYWKNGHRLMCTTDVCTRGACSLREPGWIWFHHT